MDLVPEVTVVVHPRPSGSWRWAVMVGGRPPTDLDCCVQASEVASEGEASLLGEQVGAATVKALRLMGVPARYGYLRLGYDPLPADAYEQPFGVWHGKDGA